MIKLDPEAYYTKDSLLSTLSLSYDVLCIWIDTGLPFIVTGPDEYIVKGLDVLNFMRKNTVIRTKIEDGE